MTEIEKRLPDYYKKSRYMSAICKASDIEFDKLYGKMDEFEKNISTDTATESGIIALERDLCIKPTNDPIQTRISRIKAKKRGTQTMSEANLTSILRLFDPTASIKQNVSNYSFNVTLTPPDVLDEIMNLVEDLKPAHLAVNYMAKLFAKSDIYAGSKVVGIKRKLPKAEAEIPCGGTAAAVIVSGGKVIGIKRRLRKVDAMKYNTYEDLRKYSHEEIKDKTYLELLYKEDL